MNQNFGLRIKSKIEFEKRNRELKRNRKQLSNVRIERLLNDHSISDLFSRKRPRIHPFSNLSENQAFPSCLKASKAAAFDNYEPRVGSCSVEIGNGTRPESSNPVICRFSRKNVSSLNVITASRPFSRTAFFTRRRCAADNLRRRNGRGVETRATRSTPFRGRSLADKRAARTYQTLAKAIIAQ